MIEIKFPISLGLYYESPEELKQAYRNYKNCFEQIASFVSGVRNDLDDLKQAIQITSIGLCAGDWERIEIIRQRLNKKIDGLRQAQEDFPKHQKIYKDLFYNLYGERVRSVLPKGVKTVSDVEAMNL